MGINEYRRRKGENQGDIFSTLDSYDPNEMYVGAVDDKGHSRHVRVALPPDVVGLLEAIIGTKQWPYGSPQQIIRDATIHHCKWLSETSLNGDTEAMVRNIITRERLNNMERFMKSSADIVDKARQLGTQAMQSKDWRQLSQIVEYTNDCIDGMHEPYAGQLTAMVDEFTAALPEQWRPDAA